MKNGKNRNDRKNVRKRCGRMGESHEGGNLQMTKGVDETPEQEIHYLHVMIDEARDQGFHQIANLLAAQLKTLMDKYYNEPLVGNKPKQKV